MRKVEELGLDPGAVDLTSIEAIACTLRRTASCLCPCTGPTLVRNVVRPLRGLVDDLDATKTLVEDTLEVLIAHGDILEHKDVNDDLRSGVGNLLYAAPASFIVRKSGALIMLGAAQDQFSALPEEILGRIEYVNHVRRLSPAPEEDLRTDLAQLGLIEISYDRWLRSPAIVAPLVHVQNLDRLLDKTPPSRDVPGLVLLDPERPVHYYRGRWVELRTQTGRFVGRRHQAYGADLWCYVEVHSGHPERLIDFPVQGSRWRGCDEAWRLQLGIDSQRGDPQRFKLRSGPKRSVVLELFSPLPMWAIRRWDTVGEPVMSTGCLFAYRFSEAEIEEEVRFATEELWLGELHAKI